MLHDDPAVLVDLMIKWTRQGRQGASTVNSLVEAVFNGTGIGVLLIVLIKILVILVLVSNKAQDWETEILILVTKYGLSGTPPPPLPTSS